MQFLEWLYTEKTDAAKIQWGARSNLQWSGKFVIGNIAFTIDFWRPFDLLEKNFGNHWEVEFDQTSGHQSLGLIEFMQLFQTIDEALLELINRTGATEIKIFPAVLNSQRREVLKKRNSQASAKIKSDGWMFDPSKFHSYQQLFQFSKLTQMGYTMTPEGNNLMVRKLEKAVG